MFKKTEKTRFCVFFTLLDYNSSNVVYLLECRICSKQYVGSTNTKFRQRFNNYKCFSKKFDRGVSVPQRDFFQHFREEGHSGFLDDVSVRLIDRLYDGNRRRKLFWQFELDSFVPGGLNSKEVEIY